MPTTVTPEAPVPPVPARSLLPNSAPHILQPLVSTFARGTFQVVWMAEIDAHVLLFTREGRTSQLAAHHNGHCCYELAKRIDTGDKASAVEQLHYIRDCGGMGTSMKAFNWLFFSTGEEPE